MLEDGLGDSQQATVQSVAQEFEAGSVKIQEITKYFVKQISMVLCLAISSISTDPTYQKMV